MNWWDGLTTKQQDAAYIIYNWISSVAIKWRPKPQVDSDDTKSLSDDEECPCCVTGCSGNCSHYYDYDNEEFDCSCSNCDEEEDTPCPVCGYETNRFESDYGAFPYCSWSCRKDDG